MELNMNMNCMRGYSLEDDDNFSNISRISCGLQNSLNSTCNSDSECSGPISVRNMIEHYNNQFKNSESNQVYNRKMNIEARRHLTTSQHLLASTKSSYCGINNYGSDINYKRFTDADPNDDGCHKRGVKGCCMNCTACAYCQNGSRKNAATTRMLSSTSSSFLLLQPNENSNKKLNSNFSIHRNMNTSSSCNKSTGSSCNKINAKDTDIPAVKNCSNFAGEIRVGDGDGGVDADINDFCAELDRDSSSGLLKNHNSQVVVSEKKQNPFHSSTADVEEKNTSICQQPPIETSYHSKTTISKTTSGVRIIIDIFFDQERMANATDILGSRVETDIPQSRILSEFQQQTMSATANAVSSS